MGADELSCGFLCALLGAPEIRVRAVVTQPDRPRGRHLRLQSCPVRAMVLEQSLGLDVLTPANVNAPESLRTIAALAPEVVVVVAYGQLLKQPLLDLPPLGCLNLHLSLLPALRGAAPIVRAILEGHRETGVTAMQMDRGMDSGDILGAVRTAIAPDETAGTLTRRLTALGTSLMLETLAAMRDGTLTRTPQDASRATYAPKLQKDEWLLDWSRDAEVVCRTVRAFHPKPGATTFLPPEPAEHLPLKQPGRLLKVLRAVPDGEAPRDASPGTVVRMQQGLWIAAGDGRTVRLLEVRPEGRPRSITGAEFVNGYRTKVHEGDRFFPGLSAVIDSCDETF